MAKEIPSVSFRRTKQDPEAERAFIETGALPESEAPKSTAPLSLVRPVEDEVEESAVELEPAKPPAVQTSSRQAVGRSAAASSSLKKASSKGRQILQRADGREVRKRTIYLPVSESLTLDITCAQLQRDLSEVAQEAFAMWLAKNSPR